MAQKRTRAKRLAISCVLCGLVVVVGTMISLMRHAREIEHSSDCRNNLTFFATGMYDYHERHGHLPAAHVEAPDGSRMHSWRTYLFTMISIQRPDYDYGEPWNSPKNSRVAQRYFLESFACPSDPKTQSDLRLTNYFVVEGDTTPFPGANTTSLADIRSGRGLANTVLIVESCGMNVQWSQPRDLLFETASLGIGAPNQPGRISSYHPDGPYAAMADGSKRSLHGIDPRVLRQLLQIDAHETDQGYSAPKPP